MLRTFRRPWMRHSFRADVRRIPWPDRRIPWPDVRGLCQLPERRAICRSTNLKCCDRVPDAVSCDATICLIRDEEPGSSDAVCRQNALLVSSGSLQRGQAATFPASPAVTARSRLTVCTAVSSLQKQ